MNTKFKAENMTKELPIDGDKDVVLVLRDRDGVQDYFLHLPPFEGSDKDFPSHIGTGLAIAACLHHEDKEFYQFISVKFKEYCKEFLGNLPESPYKSIEGSE